MELKRIKAAQSLENCLVDSYGGSLSGVAYRRCQWSSYLATDIVIKVSIHSLMMNYQRKLCLKLATVTKLAVRSTIQVTAGDHKSISKGLTIV